MTFTLEYEQEEDGRWLAEVRELPGVMVNGNDPDDAVAHAQVLALRVVADRLEKDKKSSRFHKPDLRGLRDLGGLVFKRAARAGTVKAVQSASLFYICPNALPNPPSPPIDEKGKRPDGA